MKLGTWPKTAARERGFSLIELMVSLTLGLVIMTAVLSVYLGASDAGKISDMQSRMNEDGQAALSILSQHIRMAGNNPVQPQRINELTPQKSSLRNPIYQPAPALTNYSVTPNARLTNVIRGCDGTRQDIKLATDIDQLDCTSGNWISERTDAIVITYEADTKNTLVSTNGLPTDALGAELPAITVKDMLGADTEKIPDFKIYVADNRFFLSSSVSGSGMSLYGFGNGGNTPQPMVENIEDLQISYGLAGSVDETAVGRYETATRVQALGKWGRVLAVRLCVLVRSDQAVAPDTASAAYVDCHHQLQSAKDLYLRHAYHTTVGLRNRLP